MQKILLSLFLLLCPLMAQAEDASDPIHEVTGQEGYGSVEFYDFKIVERKPGPPESFTATKDTPKAGADVIGDATLMGKIDDIAFYVIDENGRKLEDLKLIPNFEGDHYRGHFTMPPRVFRVVAYGKDEDRKKFARVTVKWIRPGEVHD